MRRISRRFLGDSESYIKKCRQWRNTNTKRRAQATKTIPWKPRHDAEKDKGAKVADRHHV